MTVRPSIEWPAKDPATGEWVRALMTASSLSVWIVMGTISAIFLRQTSADRALAVVASVFACLITIWACDRASTANDFLTVTSTTRLICIAYLLLTIYGLSQKWSGLAWIEWPAPIDAFIEGQFSSLIGPIGIISMLLTDYLRTFTIPTKRGRLLEKIWQLVSGLWVPYRSSGRGTGRPKRPSPGGPPQITVLSPTA